jgi:TetR/AcrR family transcriptional repressor of nem operon
MRAARFIARLICSLSPPEPTFPSAHRQTNTVANWWNVGYTVANSTNMGRKSDAKTRILSSALALIHERGYGNVGVEDIMQAAGVGKSSFYHFFKSKEALGEQVIEEYSRLTCQELFDKAFDPEIAPLERPRTLLTMLASDDSRPVNGCLGGNSAAENSTVSVKLREKTREFLDLVVSKFEDTYADAVAVMDLHPDAPIEELAQASVAFVQGGILLCKIKQSWQPLRDLTPLFDNLWKPYAL